MMKLKVWGGAGEHGRSCYICSGERHRIMFDCGVKKEEQGVYPLLDAEEVKGLTAVFLSHAHEDHSMAIPLLYKLGYKGVIWTTRVTVGQLGSYFASWEKYTRRKGGELPYGNDEIAALNFRFIEDLALPGQWCEPQKGLRMQWGRSGHLSGSVWLKLEVEGKRIFFSGDYSSESQLLMADSPYVVEKAGEGDGAVRGLGRSVEAEDFFKAVVSHAYPAPFWTADLAIMDNAYGLEDEPQRHKLEQLWQAAGNTYQAGGHLMLPVPAFGRSQELLVWAAERLPEFMILAEQEIWQGLTKMLEQQLWLQPGALERIYKTLENGRVKIPHNDADRLRLLNSGKPCLILTPDGMMESLRAHWYYDQLSHSPGNEIILTGHASRDSFAKHLQASKSHVSSPRVRTINYKVHQGLQDVQRMLNQVPSRRTLLFHAPQEVTDQVVAKLAEEGREGLYSLKPGEELEF